MSGGLRGSGWWSEGLVVVCEVGWRSEGVSGGLRGGWWSEGWVLV